MEEQPKIDDVRIVQERELTPPCAVLDKMPADDAVKHHIIKSRKAIEKIIHGGDDRLLVVVGPCSIHSEEVALEYAHRLAEAAQKYQKHLFIIMRVYFEKPRTTIGWKGLINDPDLNGTYDINKGLSLARRVLLKLNGLGIPCGTEFLDIISPQYFADLISWGAIGARTTESQIHRELASGLSCPMGFKNGTGGDIKIAADALRSSAQSHHFLSITKQGVCAVSKTKGNKSCHIILRGGGGKPNYDSANVNRSVDILSASGLPGRLMIDCSHANSEKDYRKQPATTIAVGEQIAAGDMRIIGVMLESNLKEGNQEIIQGQELVFGQSVTDSCINWESTVELLEKLANTVATRQRYLRSQE